ncbi:hypothetical protein [Sphingomonas sp. DBB INV C78]|uniref:hypothetical protein n=1 Tax=Sphingomonas sp. DBB INV C78 TaxID=3349434 RepID=UPI0036D211C1
MKRKAMAGAAMAATAAAFPVHAQEAEGGDHDLAKKLSNPISNLISVPLQENMDFGAGPSGDGFKSTLNVQPVVPISLGSKWNLILRTILPIAYQEDISADGRSESGLGDTTQSFFFSPKQPGPSGIVWGVGPALLYPTATDHRLGGEKWGAGPTLVVLKQSGKNTIGMLANHIWSFAGDDSRGGISSTFIQPFFAHNTSTATTYSINAEASYDWKSEKWVVPINLLVAQLTKVGKQSMQFGVGGRYYIEKPTGGPDWGLRFVVTFLFPQK